MGVMDRRTLVKEGRCEVHEGILCQTKKLEYSLNSFEEMIKWEHCIGLCKDTVLCLCICRGH